MPIHPSPDRPNDGWKGAGRASGPSSLSGAGRDVENELGTLNRATRKEKAGTALTRWEPLGLEWPERWRRWLDLDNEIEGMLRIEETRENGNLLIRAEMPGVDPEKDVEVTVSDGVLHISGKREERTETKDKDKHTYRSEFRYGQFSRDLTLPAGIDPDSIDAKYDNGILEVRVPWPTQPESKKTKVKVDHR
jgi:HSP20 family protein